MINKTALSDRNVIEMGLDADIFRRNTKNIINYISTEINWSNTHLTPSDYDWKQLIDHANCVQEAKNNVDNILLQYLQHVPKRRQIPKRANIIQSEKLSRKKNGKNWAWKETLIYAKNRRRYYLN